MTNSELVIETFKSHPANEFERHEVMGQDDARKLSPYFTYATAAGILTKIGRGRWRKTELLNRPTAELAKLMNEAMNRRDGQPRQPKEPEAMEVDVYDLLDQLPMEKLLDVVAAKWNVVATLSEPLRREVTRLQDQLALKDQQIKSLKLEALRMEEQQKKLNHENTRLTALMATDKPNRLVLAKPVNASGNAVFKEGDRIKIFRQAK